MKKTLNTKQSLGFKKKVIATAVASVLLGGNHMAQAQTEGAVEEVVVTGIRASLQRSMDLKRESKGVVDAISAEDIGKFPDNNLAESLQRITGVSIDRQNGEGSKVTVRGLGPDFNLVTLNGRQMPGAAIENEGASGTRSFDFGNLASEGVSAVEVYKTSRADVSPGGMGATINIVTPKPLKSSAKASVALKEVLDESSGNDSTTPEVSGIYIGQFADDKIGVALTGSYQKRNGGSASAGVGGQRWHSFQSGADGWGSLSDNPANFNRGGNLVNPPQAGDVYSTPRSFQYNFTEFKRERTNAQLTLQYSPVEEFTATLDYTYAENETNSLGRDVGAWMDPSKSTDTSISNVTAVFSNLPNGSVETPLLYSERHFFDTTLRRHTDLGFSTNVNSRVLTNDSVGLNLDWNPREDLKFSFDFHDSVAKGAPGSSLGSENSLSVAAHTRARSTVDFRGEMPILYLDVVDFAGGSAVREQDLRVTGSVYRTSLMEHGIKQAQFEGEWKLNEEITFTGGLARVEGDYYSEFSNNEQGTWGGLGVAGDLANKNLFTKGTILDRFSGDYTLLTAQELQNLGATTRTPFNDIMLYDPERIRAYAAKNYDDGKGNALCADGSTWYCAQNNPDGKNRVLEDSDSFYLTANYTNDYVSANLGVRYESTEVTSPTTSPVFGPAVWGSNNEIDMPQLGFRDTVAKGEYDYTLPSLDVAFTGIEDVILRASYGESISRPSWLDLRGGASFSGRLRPDGGGTGSRDRPDLKPTESENIDVSAEWYYDDTSYASIGYFTKDVSGFLASSTVPKVSGLLENTPNPDTGPRADAARAAGNTTPGAIRDYILANFPDPETAYRDSNNNIVIVGIPGQDRDALFDITQKSNTDKTFTVDGVEFAVQHYFGESGFGFQANYTLVDSDTEYNNLLIGEPQRVFTGVSDTANLVGFYENDGLQVRLAYNWRDSFLATENVVNNNPLYVEDYSQIDVSISYDLTDNFTVFAEGLNVTSESRRLYMRSKDQIFNYQEGYARYNVGARYTF